MHRHRSARHDILNGGNPRVMLLFFRDFERDKFVKYDRYLKRLVRPLYNLTHSRQKKTGFAVAFSLLCRALEQAGYDARVNDFSTARRNPEYPIGIAGYPEILDGWKLRNPAVIGPGLYDHPMLAPDLMKDRRFRRYVVTAPWIGEIFRAVYGDVCFDWFAGIDLDEWPDLSTQPKQFDFLVYDKVRWNYDEFCTTLIVPILAELERRQLTYSVLRYGKHDHRAYRRALAATRGMIFLCEHETQGLAYQEAMASNIPILAWDRGLWADPLGKRFHASIPKASSVPFFSPACGRKFVEADQFQAALTAFLSEKASYRPRDFVAKHLNLRDSAAAYATEYFALCPPSVILR
jgi:glycosyltransferase involved in cell wall biosynthesis